MINALTGYFESGYSHESNFDYDICLQSCDDGSPEFRSICRKECTVKAKESLLDKIKSDTTRTLEDVGGATLPYENLKDRLSGVTKKTQAGDPTGEKQQAQGLLQPEEEKKERWKKLILIIAIAAVALVVLMWLYKKVFKK